MAVRIAWLRVGDLRLRDNPALHAAAEGGARVVPAFVWCPAEERQFTCAEEAASSGRDWSYEGTAIQALLPAALRSLDSELHRRYGNRLRILCTSGEAGDSTGGRLLRLAAEVGAAAVHFNRREEPAERRREGDLQREARAAGLRCEAHGAFLFRDPERCPIREPWAEGCTCSRRSGTAGTRAARYGARCLLPGPAQRPRARARASRSQAPRTPSGPSRGQRRCRASQGGRCWRMPRLSRSTGT
ncbi:unnamed protein product [Prorocentrum cordatum]|uniref:Photolyase/cryptochrome alpha/beta domain-containing protein n=1 Tax=Prorocentrum cordatum TaxID=2364126 RepID=A0ABN9Y922_9DINO|nr:unnamed protein product [Polarella glacialis]